MSDSVSVPVAATKVANMTSSNFPISVFYSFVRDKLVKTTSVPDSIKLSACISNGFEIVFSRKDLFNMIPDNVYILCIQYKDDDFQICFTGKMTESESYDESMNRCDNSTIAVDREISQEIGLSIKSIYKRKNYVGIYNQYDSQVRHHVYNVKELQPYVNNVQHHRKTRDDHSKRVSAILYGSFEDCTKALESISCRRKGAGDTNDITGACILKKSVITDDIMKKLCNERDRVKVPKYRDTIELKLK